VAESRLTNIEVEAFLTQRHAGAAITDLAPLSGGFWSSAFAYRAAGEDRELVVRFGQLDGGFDADHRAMAYASDDLPVPEVLELGRAFGGSYAISVRAHGRFLEDVTPDEAGVAGPMIVRLLGALHAATPPTATEPPDAWRAFLAAGFVDDPQHPVHGWRDKLAAEPEVERVFLACEARVRELAHEVCPERRDLLHGDLLHKNVLVSDDASRVNAVFSWKCSVRGDFLFDTAWCTFWGHVHPGIAAADVWRGVTASPWANADPAMLADAALRHHCYELQIGGSHLGWYAWTGDDDLLRSTAAHTAALLDRGPLDRG
jgi:aminoglycoside phosphotransferase (APT) family kinase protein